MVGRIGYACVNMSLKPKKFRNLRLKTVYNKGIAYLREICLHNVAFTEEILRWNEAHGIGFYRMTSDLLPLVTHPDILRDFSWRWHEDDRLLEAFASLKAFAGEAGMRLSMHPDQFTVLNSPRREVVENALGNLTYHARVMTLSGGSDILIHGGGVYGDKAAAMERFRQVYGGLSPSVRRYLRLENDDVSYTAADVLALSDATGIPLVLDYHHDRCNPSPGLDRKRLAQGFMASWGAIGIRPKVHLSTGRGGPVDRRHADRVSLEDFRALEALLSGYTYDLMLEAKHKELAVLGLVNRLEQEG